jgi:hypothetical protein
MSCASTAVSAGEQPVHVEADITPCLALIRWTAGQHLRPKRRKSWLWKSRPRRSKRRFSYVHPMPADPAEMKHVMKHVRRGDAYGRAKWARMCEYIEWCAREQPSRMAATPSAKT